MSVIWVIEKTKPSEAPASRALMGDFAVRAFASLETLEKLLKVSRSQRPDLLLVDRDDVVWETKRVRAFLAAHFPETPVLVLSSRPESELAKGSATEAVFFLSKPIDGLSLSLFADFALRSSGGSRRNVIRYKGLLLDSEKMQCLIQPGTEPVTLSRREAQLLKLLLERPGTCLSRGEIQKAIWEGIRVTPRTIDVHVSRLRKQLGGSCVEIESVYGGGYRLT